MAKRTSVVTDGHWHDFIWLLYMSLVCYPRLLVHMDGALIGLSIGRLQYCSQHTRLLIAKLRQGVPVGPMSGEEVSARPNGTQYLCKPTIGPVL